MNPYEVEARFAHAKEAGRRTGCAPLKGKTEKTWTLKQLERYIVVEGVCLSPDYMRDIKGNIRRVKK